MVLHFDQTATSIACARECKKIDCKGFSFKKLGNGIAGECHLQLNQSSSFNNEEEAEYYIKL